MSYFKKFCDLIGGIGAFFATVFVLGKYMSFDPKDLEEGQSKLKFFFSNDNSSEYRQYLVFIGLIVLTIVVGQICKKLPWMSLAVSVLPMCQAMSMLYCALFYNNAFFYVAICAIMIVGNLYEVMLLDKERGKSRTALAARIIALLGAALAGISIKLSSLAAHINELSLGEEGLAEEHYELIGNVKPFGVMLLKDTVYEKEIKALIFFAAAFALCILIGLLVRKAYFIEAILSFVPFAFSVSALHAEKLTTAPMLVIVPAAVYFISMLSLTFTTKE